MASGCSSRGRLFEPRQAVRAEAREASQGCTATVLQDLQKCNEMVRTHLWVTAGTLHCPLDIPRLSVESHRWPRRIQVSEAVFDSVFLGHGFVFGRAFPTTLAHSRATFPNRALAVFVDDAGFHAEIEEGDVVVRDVCESVGCHWHWLMGKGGDRINPDADWLCRFEAGRDTRKRRCFSTDLVCRCVRGQTGGSDPSQASAPAQGETKIEPHHAVRHVSHRRVQYGRRGQMGTASKRARLGTPPH